MNIKTTAFLPQQALKEIVPLILSKGSELLKNSRKVEKYEVSLRELFGLCILASFREFLNPKENWVFSTDSQLSDDGVVASFDKSSNHFNYYESVEQVYLPGNFLEREIGQHINDYILNHISRTKDKGAEYKTDKTLFIFSDIGSKNKRDYFEWQDFVKKFFKDKTFLHLYFISLTEHSSEYNRYYFLSFTNQKHRQKLNGEFELIIRKNGDVSFKCSQKLCMNSD